MQKNELKKIVANILYVNDFNDLQDDVSLFRGYDFSSIDYIDLCFELKEKTGSSVEPNELWPFNAMMNDPKYYQNGIWTDVGWEIICEKLTFDKSEEKMPIDVLYEHFNINYIDQFLKSIQ